MIVAVLQARMSSVRFPGKVLAPILGEPMLARQIARIGRADIDRIVVATSDTDADDAIARLCRTLGVECYRGALHDVLSRVYGAAQGVGPADHVVRLTADCPLADWQVIDACVALHRETGADYTGNAVQRSYPDGLDVEVLRSGLLDHLWRNASTAEDREHVTTYVRRQPDGFRIAHLRQARDLSALRWTVDWPEDLEMIRAVFAAFLPHRPDFFQDDILELLHRSPEIAAINDVRCAQRSGSLCSTSAEAAPEAE